MSNNRNRNRNNEIAPTTGTDSDPGTPATLATLTDGAGTDPGTDSDPDNGDPGTDPGTPDNGDGAGDVEDMVSGDTPDHATTLPARIRVPVTFQRAVVEWREVNVSDLLNATIRFIFLYGLRQMLNDAKASARSAGAALGMVDKRLDNIRAGLVGRRGPGAGSTPETVEDIALEIAVKRLTADAVRVAKVNGILSKKGKASDLPDNYKAAIEAQAPMIAASPGIMTLAQAEFDARAAAASVAVMSAGLFTFPAPAPTPAPAPDSTPGA